MAEKILISSESVTEGHPDKLADQISDGVLDAILAQDPMSRVACETLVATGAIIVAGEITTKAYVDIPGIARKAVLDVGYNRAKFGFDGETCAVFTQIDEQSGDIAMGVDRAMEIRESEMDDDQIDRIGAGDQGMMIGYATDETPEFLPMPFALAQRLARRLTAVRKDGTLNCLRPDGKTQVTLEYRDGVAVAADTIVVSSQHSPMVSLEELRDLIARNVIEPIMPKELMKNPRILVNPTGRFVLGGPMADTGLTGRKIIVTRTAAWCLTAAALSPARTRRRWTVRAPTWPATPPKTSSRPAWPGAVRSRWLTPSAWLAPFRCTWRLSEPPSSTRNS